MSHHMKLPDQVSCMISMINMDLQVFAHETAYANFMRKLGNKNGKNYANSTVFAFKIKNKNTNKWREETDRVCEYNWYKWTQNSMRPLMHFHSRTK